MSVRRYAGAPDRPRRTRWAIAAVVAVLGLGGLIVAAPSRVPGKVPPRAEHSPVLRTSAPRPAESPRATREEAVKTAVRAVYDLALPALTDASLFERSLSRMSADGREAALRTAFQGDDKLRADLASGILRSAPLGYRIEQFDGRAAAVSVWIVSLAAGPRVPTQASWRRLTFDMKWERDRWMVSGGAGGPAPSPSSSGQAAVLEASTYRELTACAVAQEHSHSRPSCRSLRRPRRSRRRSSRTHWTWSPDTAITSRRSQRRTVVPPQR